MIDLMVEVLGDLFPYAVGVGLSPLPLIAVFFVLRSPSARAAGAAFVLSRFVVVAAVATIVAVLAEFIPEPDGASTPGSIARIVVGVALLVWGIVLLSRRTKSGEEAELPGWMSSIENVSVWGAVRLGVLLSIANIKEIAFGIGAGLIIGTVGLGFGFGAIVVAAIVYAVVACAGIIVAVAAFLIAEERTRIPLEAVRTWLVRNNKVLIALVLLVIGAILVGEGVSYL